MPKHQVINFNAKSKKFNQIRNNVKPNEADSRTSVTISFQKLTVIVGLDSGIGTPVCNVIWGVKNCKKKIEIYSIFFFIGNKKLNKEKGLGSKGFTCKCFIEKEADRLTSKKQMKRER